MLEGFGLARLGRDAEVRHTQGGDAVASLSLAFVYGRKGDDNKRPTQWVDASLWGKVAEALAPYLTKGSLVAVSLEDVHIETYQGRNGEGYKLAARVKSIDLAGGGTERAAAPTPAPAPAPAARQQQRAMPPAQSTGTGFDQMDDDIPFSAVYTGRAWSAI